MARRSQTRRKPGRRGQYLRHRNTTSGRVLPPIDIRSPSGLGELLKRIRKGPVTIVLVYADWCGHCKEFKPIFENAEKSPNRTAQTVKVNDIMFPQMTDAIKHKLNMNATPMSVEGYPSVILVDKKGNMIQNVAAVKDQGTMNSLMEKAGTLAKESVAKTATSIRSTTNEEGGPRTMNIMAGKPLPSLRVPKNSMAPSANVASVSANVEKSLGSFRNSSAKASSIENEQPVTSVPPVASAGSDANEVSVTTPPGSDLIEDDIVSNESPMRSARQGGGGLLAALGSSAYQLAPAGVLLALAATMKRRGRARRVKTQRRRR